MKDLTRRRFNTLAASMPILATAAGAALANKDVSVQTTEQAQIRTAVLSDNLTMHTYLSNGLPGGMGSVNSHVFESSDAILVFDTQFYKAAAQDLRMFVEGLGKPVERIIISHAHPDHVFGTAWLSDLAPVMATEAVRAEAAQLTPFFANMMVQRMGEDAAKANFPIDNLPEIPETLTPGTFDFGGTKFDIFDMPTHEVGIQSFVGIPEHRLLMVFDSIMPNAFQLVFSAPGQSFEDRLRIGEELIAILEAKTEYDSLIFGHNSTKPLPASEQLPIAREGLAVYRDLAASTETAQDFIAGAKAAKPDWGQFYVQMSTGAAFPEG